MSKWNEVGDWLKANAGSGASLVGSLLTGNVPGAVAAGIALVSSATGSTDPVKALEQLQSNPQTVVELRRLALQEEASIREHIRELHKLELEDAKNAHKETQETIRSGDNAEDVFVRRTRPAQSWVSLFAALVYVFAVPSPDVIILGTLLALPWAYAGLRQVGKGIDSIVTSRNNK
jgi:hypothetical protein